MFFSFAGISLSGHAPSCSPPNPCKGSTAQRTCFKSVPARQRLAQQAQHGGGVQAAQVAQRGVWVLGRGRRQAGSRIVGGITWRL